jgi:hypothetical protein
MFKLINLALTIFITYHFIQTTSAFNTMFNVAADTGNSAGLIYSGVHLIIYTLYLCAIYITVFGSSEVYVTTQIIEEEEEGS